MEARVELGDSGLRSAVGECLWGRGHSPAWRAESDGGLASTPPRVGEVQRPRIHGSEPRTGSPAPEVVGDVGGNDIPRKGEEGGGHGNPLQHSRQEHPTDRGVWRATVHRAAQSPTGLK